MLHTTASALTVFGHAAHRGRPPTHERASWTPTERNAVCMAKGKCDEFVPPESVWNKARRGPDGLGWSPRSPRQRQWVQKQHSNANWTLLCCLGAHNFPFTFLLAV